MDDNNTLLLYIPNTGVFKDISYHQLCIAGLLFFARGVPTNHKSKMFYHFTRSLQLYMFKKHSSFSFIALLFMPCLSEYERSGAIGMLKADVRVSDVARYHKCHPSTIQRLKDRYKATAAVKDRCRSGQPRMATSIKSQVASIVF